MTVYNINKAIGRASSGVEYAQLYRYQALENMELEQKYVFMDYIGTNLISFTDNMGFSSESIIWLYGYLAGQKNRPTTYSLEQFLATIEGEYSQKDCNNHLEIYLDAKVHYKIWLTEHFVDKVELYFNGHLESATHYTDRLSTIEYFSGGKLVSRTFFREDGEIAYRQFYQDKKITLTFYENQILVGRQAFFKLFFEKIKLNEKDFVIIDRSLDIVDALLPYCKNTPVAVVIHAEHYNIGASSDKKIIWNNFYEYVFTNHDQIDYFITSTKRQKEIMEKQFEEMYGEIKTKIITIPVGHIANYPELLPDEVVKFKLMTASRLADEKHVDQIVGAVIQMKNVIPELSLDIYGEGKQNILIKKMIEQHHAENYIQLMGHQELSQIYSNYGLYVTGSTSEGFGLSLMEALGSGLPIIGLDVEYGNKEFIEDGVNGVLVASDAARNNKEQLKQLLRRFYLEDLDYRLARLASLEKGRAYSFVSVRNLWGKLVFNSEKCSTLLEVNRL